MAYQEIEFGREMHEFKLNEPLEGELKEVREDVGKNKSNVYSVGDKTFWGTAALDPLMERVNIGQKVKITLVDTSYKFPNGRVGKRFKVEVDK